MSDTEKSASSNNKFLKGTLILTVSSIVVKVIVPLGYASGYVIQFSGVFAKLPVDYPEQKQNDSYANKYSNQR